MASKISSIKHTNAKRARIPSNEEASRNNNPVKAGIVEKPEDYLLSSARDYCSMKARLPDGQGLLPIEHLTAAYTLRS